MIRVVFDIVHGIVTRGIVWIADVNTDIVDAAGIILDITINGCVVTKTKDTG